ncbi:MAG: FixH family protein [Thermomonas sp.]|uniref:FixH family protein n=1 Tax=Thermomonas sp. TaxID=1971895 RepID=UPI0039E48B4C
MDETQHSPWRQPLVWLVAGIPTVAVIALAWMVFIAAGPGSTDTVDPAVKRTAQIQTADLGPDETAAKLQLAALLRVDGEQLELLALHSGFDTNTPLKLLLRHPARADLDRDFLLQPGGAGWRVDAPALELGHDWAMQLQPQDGKWRLQGRLPRGQLSARLQPTLPQ